MNERQPPEQIRNWLVERIAHYLECPATAIDPDASLAGYGLDSVCKFALCCDIEDAFDLIIEPIVLWDAESVSALTPHIAGIANSSSS